jgi:hypothetical protein
MWDKELLHNFGSCEHKLKDGCNVLIRYDVCDVCDVCDVLH